MGRVVVPTGALSPQNIDTTINKITAPKRLLTELLYPESTAKLLSKESVAWGEIIQDYVVAPFTKVNGQAINIARNPKTLQAFSITTPYIGIKHPLNFQEDFEFIEFGDNSGRYFPMGVEDTRGAERFMQQMNEDLINLRRAVDLRKEWMASRTFLGSLSYASTEETGADFSIDFNKPAGNTITPTTYLDDTDMAKAINELRSAIRSINKLQSERMGPTITDAICGADVATVLWDMKLAGAFDKLVDRDYNYVQDVNVSIKPEFQYEGTYEHILRLDNVNFWAFTQQLKVDGEVVDLIRPKYIELIGKSVVSENRTFYGAITNSKLKIQKATVRKEWSFTWEENTAENITWEQYLVTRPLMIPRRPDWYYSYVALA